MGKLTIEELEAVLNSEEDIPVTILGNGEVSWPANVSKKIKRCLGCDRPFLDEVKFFNERCSVGCMPPIKMTNDTKIGEFHYVYKKDGHDEPGTDFITVGMLSEQAQSDLRRGYEARVKAKR